MQTIPIPATPVKRIRHKQLYVAALMTYAATWRDQHGTIEGTAREVYYGGCLWLEWQATHCYQRQLIRRDDPRLTLGGAL